MNKEDFNSCMYSLMIFCYYFMYLNSCEKNSLLYSIDGILDYVTPKELNEIKLLFKNYYYILDAQNKDVQSDVVLLMCYFCEKYKIFAKKYDRNPKRIQLLIPHMVFDWNKNAF